MVYLTRKAEFSASHYYHNPEFTAEENQRIFGKCNNPNGHGHNYTLEVTVKGEVDPRSGFVVDLKQLKETMSREVLEALDHRFLTKKFPSFSLGSRPRRIWHNDLAAFVAEVAGCASPPGAGIRDAGTVRRFLRGSMKAYLTRRYMFSASHRLHSDSMSEAENAATYGKCNNPYGHGHNYTLEVTVSGPVDESTGMICNLMDLDAFVQTRSSGTLRSPELEHDCGIRANCPNHGEFVHCCLRYFAARLSPCSS
jgi:6-pyruvoyltetrahydropterin/6-carboxytetrahydropterin synthase